MQFHLADDACVLERGEYLTVMLRGDDAACFFPHHPPCDLEINTVQEASLQMHMSDLCRAGAWMQVRRGDGSPGYGIDGGNSYQLARISIYNCVFIV
jgi:hypothetical protein